MEILYYYVTGSGSSLSEAMTLKHNTAGDTNYSVFPSIYYGYGGSSGTYDATGTSGAVQIPVINLRTSSSFHFNMEKSTGDNVNIYIVFLVVYGTSTSAYPSSY
jgi:hypothetical protein